MSPRRGQPEPAFAGPGRGAVPGIDLGFYLINRNGVRCSLTLGRIPRSGGAREPGQYEAIALIPPVLAAGEFVVRLWIGTSREDLLDEECSDSDCIRAPARGLPKSWSAVALPAPR